MRETTTTTTTRRRLSIAASILLGCALASAIGCANQVREERSDARPLPPKPREAPVVPEGTKVDRIALQVAPKPEDTNGNGYPDRIELIAYLFASQHPTPFYEDGTFVFDLYFGGQSDMPGAEPIHTWRIGGEALHAARNGVNIVGPHYLIRLSLLEGENGTDRYPLLQTDISCRFEPADGRNAVVRQGVHKIQIGKGAIVGANR